MFSFPEDIKVPCEMCSNPRVKVKMIKVNNLLICIGCWRFNIRGGNK